MPPPGGTRTSLSFSMTGPLGGRMMQAFQPTAGMFSPGLPLQPTQGQQPTRSFDFPVGLNSFITPRGGFGQIHSFASLKAYSNVELVRLAIETCKDQIERLDWQVKPKDGKKARKDDGRITALEKLFRRPDGITPFSTFLRRLLDDLLVLDAPAIERQRNRGGEIIGLEYVPGETIKLLVDETGRTPRAPLPAYQQIIKGTVWGDLTTNDLIYAPRNPRPNHLYGFSPVEQIIVTCETISRRQAVQLGYFTEGTTPAGILNVPAGWQADSIKLMQDSWDARMEGNLPGKSKQIWVPEGTKYQPFKESPLKDEFDEWLARVISFAFSLPPTAFVKQMNRATAQSSSDTGKEEGIESRKLWWKRVADGIIQDDFGYDDLEWGWSEDVEVDPTKQATIDDLNLRNGSTTIDEVRDSRGLDVLPDGAGQQSMIYLPTGPVLVSKVVEEALDPSEPPPVMMLPHPGAPPVLGQPPAEVKPGAKETPNSEAKPDDAHAGDVATPKPTSKLGKAASVAIDRPLVRRTVKRAARTVAGVLKRAGDDVAGQVEAHLQRLGKAADDSTPTDLANLIAAQVELSDLGDLDLSDELVAIATDSASTAFGDTGAEPTEDLTNQVNTRAVAWAKNRAAELVSVQAPANIVASTRDMIRQTIADGLEQNLGSAAIAENVQDGRAFNADRAELIAKHEIATANEQGKLAGWKEAQAAGVVLKKGWQTSNNGSCCDDCKDNEDEGLIDLDASFQSGDDAAPAHPRCECVTYAEVVEDDAAASPDDED